jgi:hypothetical protein
MLALNYPRVRSTSCWHRPWTLCLALFIHAISVRFVELTASFGNYTIFLCLEITDFSSNAGLRGAVVALGAIGLALSFATLMLIVLKREHTVVRATNLAFNVIVLCGICLAFVFVILLYPYPHTSTNQSSGTGTLSDQYDTQPSCSILMCVRACVCLGFVLLKPG